MRLFFITEARFFKTPDGNIYAGEFSFSNLLWERYITVFNEVFVIGRLFEVDRFEKKENIVSNVTILPIESFENSSQFILNYKAVKQKITSFFLTYSPSSIIVRGGGPLAYITSRYCIKNDIPYGVEVIGDPYDVFAPGVIKHPLRSIFRVLFTKMQKYVVWNAMAVIYVTKSTLQRRYPIKGGRFETHASDVFINEVVDKKKRSSINEVKKIISIGSLEQMYKSPDIVLRMLKELNSEKIRYKLVWLGHGKYLEPMKEFSQVLGVHNEVKFKGSVSSEVLFKELDESDLFILASKTEGLPRAIVEAMSRGLPCIGTRVGGIPELIADELLSDVDDIEGLCSKVEFLCSDELVYNKYSQYSIDVAKEFDFSSLERKRSDFYLELVNTINKEKQ